MPDPRNVAGWEELIRCLLLGDYLEDAMEQVEIASKATGGKPVFIFYKAAVLMRLGKSKEAVLQVEKGMELAPRQLKKLTEIYPACLTHPQILDIVARYKRRKSI